MNKEFIPYEEALALKELGFDENCITWYYKQELVIPYPEDWRCAGTGMFTTYNENNDVILAPLYQQALVFLYNKSNGQVNISINGKDTNEERNQKIKEGIQALRNIQNSKS